MIDLERIRTGLGINQHQFAALVGVCHTTQSKLESIGEHRPLTLVAYGLIRANGRKAISQILDMWVEDLVPKDAEQMVLLFQLAERFMGAKQTHWRARMRNKYPALCPPMGQREAAAHRWRQDRAVSIHA